MAVIDREATHPTFATPYASIGQMLASEVRNTINTKLETQNANDSRAVGGIEALVNVFGNGAISGGLITAGAGLSVDIAAWEALVGTYIGNDASTTVGGLAPSSVNYIFARQNGAFSVNQDGSDPSATAGDFLLWGTATTDGSGVTAVSNNRRLFQTFHRNSKSVAGSSDVTLTTTEARKRTQEYTGTLTGNINVIVPLFDGSEWVIFNNTSGAFSLTVKGASGTGIAVGQGKTAILRGNGTNILRVTADNP